MKSDHQFKVGEKYFWFDSRARYPATVVEVFGLPERPVIRMVDDRHGDMRSFTFYDGHDGMGWWCGRMKLEVVS